MLFSAPISVSICNLRNSKAAGFCIIALEASDNFIEAYCSAAALIMRARFSRIASASFAIARCIAGGISTSFISTRSIPLIDVLTGLL